MVLSSILPNLAFLYTPSPLVTLGTFAFGFGIYILNAPPGLYRAIPVLSFRLCVSIGISASLLM